MSAKLFGFDSSTFIPAADFTASQSKESLWEGSQSFSISREACDFFTGSAQLVVGTPATTLDPNLPSFWSFLRLTRIDAQNVTGGYAKVRIHYAGYFSINQSQDPESGTPTTFTLSGALEEVPLLEHPKVVALSAVERALLATIAAGDAVWDISTSKIGRLDPDKGTFIPWEDQDLVSADGVAFADLG
jgi:hypothetical protein